MKQSYEFLKQHSPTLFKWIIAPDMPAGIDDAICEVMEAFASRSISSDEITNEKAKELLISVEKNLRQATAKIRTDPYYGEMYLQNALQGITNINAELEWPGCEVWEYNAKLPEGLE